MAVTRCGDCHKDFDDAMQRAYCPHLAFEMRTLVIRSDGCERICATPDEEDAFLRGGLSDGRAN